MRIAKPAKAIKAGVKYAIIKTTIGRMCGSRQKDSRQVGTRYANPEVRGVWIFGGWGVYELFILRLIE